MKIQYGSLENETIEEIKPIEEHIEPVISEVQNVRKSKIIKKLTKPLDTEKINATETLLDEFFYPGPESLLHLRSEILKWSLSKANERLNLEKQFKLNVKPHQLKSSRVERYSKFASLSLQGSQFGSERPISSCAFVPNSELILTGDWNGSCKLWTMKDLSPINVANEEFMQKHCDKISSVSAFSSGLFASCSFDGSIHLYTNGKNTTKIASAHNGRVCKVGFYPRGDMVGSCGSDGNFKLWDLATESCLLTQPAHRLAAFCFSFHPDGSLLATGGLEGIGRVWDLRSGHSIMTLQAHSKGILTMDWSSNGYSLVTAGEDNQLIVWDIRKLSKYCQIPCHTNLISTCKWDPFNTSSVISASHDGLIKIHSAFDSAEKASYNYGARVTCLDVDKGNDNLSIVAVSHDKTIKLWC